MDPAAAGQERREWARRGIEIRKERARKAWLPPRLAVQVAVSGHPLGWQGNTLRTGAVVRAELGAACTGRVKATAWLSCTCCTPLAKKQAGKRSMPGKRWKE